jgi:hypothetical protein
MKNSIVLIYLLTNILSISITHGQESTNSLGFHFSPTINNPWKNGDGLENTSFGFSTGMDFNLKLKNQIYLNTGVEYEKKGKNLAPSVRTSTPLPPTKIEISHDFHYVTIPLLFSYQTQGRNIFCFGLGSYVSYLMHYQFQIYNNDRLTFTDNRYYMDEIEYGIAATIGLLIPIGERTHFDIGLRNRFSLVNDLNSFGLNVGLNFNI